MTTAHALIKDALESSANPEQATAMMAYMRDKYLMYGIKAPARREIIRESNLLSIFPSRGDGDQVKRDLLDFVEDCWNDDYRDLQYVGMDILSKRLKWLTIVDLPWLVSLVTRKSWWDTVDWIASTAIGTVLQDEADYARTVAQEWICQDDMWLQRTALIFQLKYRDSTDADLLMTLIEQVAESDEFFLRKACGWALRQYSRYDPKAVRRFLETHELSTLTRREASKFL